MNTNCPVLQEGRLRSLEKENDPEKVVIPSSLCSTPGDLVELSWASLSEQNVSS